MTRLDEVHLLIMYGADDWKPESVRAATETSDPTASRAIYTVDELDEKLKALKAEEHELEQLIGESLAIIAGVRDGLGDKYANVLEQRFIDCEKWAAIVDGKGDEVPITTARRMVDVACDWIDSVGVSRLLRGEVDV